MGVRPSPLRWRAPTPSTPSRPRSRTRRESPLTSSVSSSQASSLRMAVPSRITTSRRVHPPLGARAPRRWCPQVKPMEEVNRQDEVEVEEEEDAPPPAQEEEDASALQVSPQHHTSATLSLDGSVVIQINCLQLK